MRLPRDGARLDERVDRDRLAVDDDQRVHVDRRDLGVFGREVRKAEQRRAHGGAVDRRLAAERSEQLLGREVVDELVGVHFREGYEAERDVAERLREDAADAEHHARAELGVAYHPRDELSRASHHRRDEQRDVSVAGLRRGQELRSGRADVAGRAETEPHEAALGLVRDRVATELQHDRVADRVGGRDGRFGIRRGAFGRHGDAVAREQLL